MRPTVPYRITPRSDFGPLPDSGERHTLSALSSPDAMLEAISHSWYDPNLVEIAITHPDERIAIAVIDRWNTRIAHEYLWKLYLRGLESSNEEGILWHPIFDALASNNCWPLRMHVSNLAETQNHYRSIEQQIQQLIPWLEAQTDPTAIEPLLGFRSRVVLGTVARHTGVITRELAQRLPLHRLAENPRLPDSWAQELISQALSLLSTARHGLVEQQPSSRFVWAIKTPVAACRVLSGLAGAKRSFSSEAIDRVVQLIGGPYQHTGLRILNAIGPSLSRAQLEQALARTSDPIVLSRLLKHPVATSETRAKALRALKGQVLLQLRLEMSGDPELMADPAVRSCVLQSQAKDVLRCALNAVVDLDSKIFREVLERCIAVVPGYVTSIARDPDQSPKHFSDLPWKKRVREEFLDDLIEGLIRHESWFALNSLLSYEPVARDSRVQHAFIQLPASLETLEKLAPYVRGDLFRQLFHHAIQEEASGFVRFANRALQEEFSGLVDLEPQDFHSLLQDQDPQKRLCGIMLLSHIQGTTDRKPRQRPEKGIQPNSF